MGLVRSIFLCAIEVNALLKNIIPAVNFEHF